MSKRVYARDAIEPWADDRPNEWFRRVREIQLISAPRPVASNNAHMFDADISLCPRIFTRRRVLQREYAAIAAGVTFGLLLSAIVVGLCTLVA